MTMTKASFMAAFETQLEYDIRRKPRSHQLERYRFNLWKWAEYAFDCGESTRYEE